MGEVLHQWLDIEAGVSEDCLHLAVHTPWRPDGGDNRTMPVMFFIHGGAFMSGTQIRYFYSEVLLFSASQIFQSTFLTILASLCNKCIIISQ